MGAEDTITTPVTDQYVDENGNTVVVGYPSSETSNGEIEGDPTAPPPTDGIGGP